MSHKNVSARRCMAMLVVFAIAIAPILIVSARDTFTETTDRPLPPHGPRKGLESAIKMDDILDSAPIDKIEIRVLPDKNCYLMILLSQ